MPVLPASPLLLLLCLGGALPSLPEDSGVRRLEVHAQAPAEAPRVRVSPGRTTVLTFDTPVQRVEVERPERWGPKLSADSRTLNLKPTSAVQVEEEVTLTVHFEDGAATEQVPFLLRVTPEGPEEVEVSRHPRTLESFRLEAGEQRARVEQCQGELARVQAERGG
ncbi:MAG TPA: DUF2381 family protein, partial [Archangium sp.]|nr:DUF2381 family protein [Archangium sp.]